MPLPSPAILASLSEPALQQLRGFYAEGSEEWQELTRRIRGEVEAQEEPRSAAAAPRGQPEKGVEHAVDQALLQFGFDVTRLSQARASKQTPGIPDRYARHPRWGLRVWIEVKAGTNTLSRHQKAWHTAERAAGGHVLTVWSVEDLTIGLRALGAPIT